MLEIFFPDTKGQSLEKVLYSWLSLNVNIKVVISNLNYINPNISIAIEILKKTSGLQDRSWLIEWLKRCEEKGNSSPDFCYHYGLFLKDIDKSKSKKWLEDAYKNGNENAKQEIKFDEVIEIKVKNHFISMQRIESQDGDFYIAQMPISNSLFIALGCNYNHGYIECVNYRKRYICNDFLKKISNETNYKWEYPTVKQWTIADRTRKIKCIQYDDGEWCKESDTFSASNYPSSTYKNRKKYRVAAYYGGDWLNEEDMSCLRPVIIVSQNPNLQ